MDHRQERLHPLSRCLIGVYLAPSVEVVIRGKERAILTIDPIANDHKSVVPKQLRYISPIAHRQLCIGIAYGSALLDSTLKLQHDHRQSIDIDHAIRYPTL